MARGGAAVSTSGGAAVSTSGGRPAEPLLPQKAPYTRSLSRPDDELRLFRSCLRWMCVDQSNLPLTVLSFSLFFLLGVFVPTASLFVLNCSPTRRAYDVVVQFSLTSASGLSFLCLSAFLSRYGLRRFLFLDKLVGESGPVREGYMDQLNRSFRLLATLVMPCFAGEVAYKVWWYSSGSQRVPFVVAESAAVADLVAAGLELASWIYRMSLFMLVCVLFRLMCYLQILRLQDFDAIFWESGPAPDVAAVLGEHFRMGRQLRIISHRYRTFIVSSLVVVSASQLTALLLTTRPSAVVNLNNSGELALSSIGLMTGLLICLQSAAKITHKAQAITSQAAMWHACATIESLDAGAENPPPPTCSSGDESIDDEDILDEMRMPPSKINNAISYQKREALVTYLEHNRAGITVFGFVVDRTWLHALFMIEFSLVMWLLGKTIWIS